jgi:hypothetical protein
MKTWPLTTVRRWAASPNSFTLVSSLTIKHLSLIHFLLKILLGKPILLNPICIILTLEISCFSLYMSTVSAVICLNTKLLIIKLISVSTLNIISMSSGHVSMVIFLNMRRVLETQRFFAVARCMIA